MLLPLGVNDGTLLLWLWNLTPKTPCVFLPNFAVFDISISQKN
jgi:hypothetical protein